MSIKLKVIISIVVVLALGTVAQLVLTNISYNKNIELISTKSLANSRESLQTFKKNDLKMMTAVIEEIAVNPEIKSAFIARDRARCWH
jgi:cytochrome c-type biogenesis protein CcmE